MVAAMAMVGLLLQNTGNFTHIPEHLQPYTEFCKWNCVTWCGFSPHSGSEVMEFFNENCEGRWIGRNGMVAWSAESPDGSPLDFFLWGCMKSRV
jgi:hypothetical protein